MHSIGRHSDSLNILKYVCGRCGTKFKKLFAKKKLSNYNLFVKKNYARVRASVPHTPHREILTIIGKQWKRQRRAPMCELRVNENVKQPGNDCGKDADGINDDNTPKRKENVPLNDPC